MIEPPPIPVIPAINPPKVERPIPFMVSSVVVCWLVALSLLKIVRIANRESVITNTLMMAISGT